ncbi:Sapep family Mn(2+)-dependent dipeptidase [Clostridium fallax]|uniref:Succinyl-diaminopimelate desuccinylase n=1 Tax=Clostridium fallax TaxID=1533 RepID=A0A1M4YG02_9CLOT|nr:Sapep family Mn(2+)-dependent dipeptidase [Clostridium fallax]SHF04583.1 succinyl-diaminopimelate desuccinylase [Clostridium fallax]SQB22327.1 dipeptidase, putative [Clostridium fallax]
MNDVVLQKIDELKEDIIEDIIEVVKIDSVESEAENGMPFGRGVNNCLVKVLEIAHKLGFKTKNLDGYIGYAELGEGKDYIGVIGHLDVVPVGDGWREPPFSGFIKDDKIYSRGILDNKGPIMTCLYALYACKKCNIKFNTPIRIIFGTNEETGMKDVEYYLRHERPPIMGWTPDCKYPVVYGERGRANLKILADKKDIGEFFQFITKYFLQSKDDGEVLGINYCDEEFGKMQIRNFALNTENHKCAFNFTLSYPAVTTILKIITKIKLKMPKSLDLELLNNYDPVKFDKNCFLVKKLKEAYEEVTGLDGEPVTTTGGTYAKIMPNIVPFGPSFPGQKGIGHNPNEWMNIKDIILNTKIYALSFIKLGEDYE